MRTVRTGTDYVFRIGLIIILWLSEKSYLKPGPYRAADA
jgi:hypothetical protein